MHAWKIYFVKSTYLIDVCPPGHALRHFAFSLSHANRPIHLGLYITVVDFDQLKDSCVGTEMWVYICKYT